MNTKIYRIIMYAAAVIAILGLISVCGGVKSVNIGAFVFPVLIAVWAFYGYNKGKKRK